VKGSRARRADVTTPAAASTTPAARSARPIRRTGKPAPGNEAWEWIKSLVIAFVLFLVIRTFLIQAYTIPSASMENTLLIGDYLMANNAIYGAHIPLTNIRMPAFREPENGDIVVFRPEYNDPVIDVVKRVMGSPGDTIQMIERLVYRNGTALNEPYLEPTYTPDMPIERTGYLGANCCYIWHLNYLAADGDRQAYQPTRDNWGPLVVPEGAYMLLGDNRDQSLDSRYAGFIPRDVIRGKAMFIYYSIDPDPYRPFPRVVTAARWGRIGHVIQ
jgi:signal peptidase I